MDTDRVLGALTVVLVAVLAVAILVVTGIVPFPVDSPDEYDRTTVTVSDENGTELGSVEARIADTFEARYVGLSDTESLGPNEGMLFVYEGESTRTFVMREMDFPLDVVFVGANRSITTIHHAPTPPPDTREDELTPYRGRAKWVLEVNRNWTTDHGVEVGDRVEIGD